MVGCGNVPLRRRRGSSWEGKEQKGNKRCLRRGKKSDRCHKDNGKLEKVV